MQKVTTGIAKKMLNPSCPSSTSPKRSRRYAAIKRNSALIESPFVQSTNVDLRVRGAAIFFHNPRNNGASHYNFPCPKSALLFRSYILYAHGTLNTKVSWAWDVEDQP